MLSPSHKVEHCRLAGLPDLDQSNSFVQSTLIKWARDIVKTYGFDGLRVDTTHMVPKDFWKEYSDSAGVFTIGEVFNRNPQYVSGYQVMYSLHPHRWLTLIKMIKLRNYFIFSHRTLLCMPYWTTQCITGWMMPSDSSRQWETSIMGWRIRKCFLIPLSWELFWTIMTTIDSWAKTMTGLALKMRWPTLSLLRCIYW